MLYKCEYVSNVATAVALANMGSGGSGGTSDYDELSNRPKINNVLLTGNKSTSDLGVSFAGLTDTDVSSPSASQPLLYDATNSKWKNGGVLPTANGGTGNSDGYIRTGQRSNTTAGLGATIEGFSNQCSNSYAHAEGASNNATGMYSHVEGAGNAATAKYAHAEGHACIANEESSHAEGAGNIANAKYTHAGGYYNEASYLYQTVIGKYNSNQSDSLFEIGNGTATDARSNAITVKSDGRITKGADDAFPAASNLATIEATTTATKTGGYSKGDYIFIKSLDKLVKVTATTIAQNATIVVSPDSGYNVEAAKVGDDLKQLSSDIANMIKQDTYTGATDTSGQLTGTGIKIANRKILAADVNVGGAAVNTATNSLGEYWFIVWKSVSGFSPVASQSVTVTYWYI